MSASGSCPRTLNGRIGRKAESPLSGPTRVSLVGAKREVNAAAERLSQK